MIIMITCYEIYYRNPSFIFVHCNLSHKNFVQAKKWRKWKKTKLSCSGDHRTDREQDQHGGLSLATRNKADLSLSLILCYIKFFPFHLKTSSYPVPRVKTQKPLETPQKHPERKTQKHNENKVSHLYFFILSSKLSYKVLWIAPQAWVVCESTVVASTSHAKVPSKALANVFEYIFSLA